MSETRLDITVLGKDEASHVLENVDKQVTELRRKLATYEREQRAAAGASADLDEATLQLAGKVKGLWGELDQGARKVSGFTHSLGRFGRIMGRIPGIFGNTVAGATALWLGLQALEKSFHSFSTEKIEKELDSLKEGLDQTRTAFDRLKSSAPTEADAAQIAVSIARLTGDVTKIHAAELALEEVQAKATRSGARRAQQEALSVLVQAGRDAEEARRAYAQIERDVKERRERLAGLPELAWLPESEWGTAIAMRNTLKQELKQLDPVLEQARERLDDAKSQMSEVLEVYKRTSDVAHESDKLFEAQVKDIDARLKKGPEAPRDPRAGRAIASARLQDPLKDLETDLDRLTGRIDTGNAAIVRQRAEIAKLMGDEAGAKRLEGMLALAEAHESILKVSSDAAEVEARRVALQAELAVAQGKGEDTARITRLIEETERLQGLLRLEQELAEARADATEVSLKQAEAREAAAKRAEEADRAALETAKQWRDQMGETAGIFQSMSRGASQLSSVLPGLGGAFSQIANIWKATENSSKSLALGVVGSVDAIGRAAGAWFETEKEKAAFQGAWEILTAAPLWWIDPAQAAVKTATGAGLLALAGRSAPASPSGAGGASGAPQGTRQGASAQTSTVIHINTLVADPHAVTRSIERARQEVADTGQRARV